MTTRTDPRLARALDLERAMHADAAGRVEDGPWGRAFVTPERPLCHQDNLVWASPGAEPADLEAATAALLPAADVCVLDVPGRGEALAAAGFDVVPEWVMAADAPPDRDDDAGAREVALEDVLPSWEHWLATDTLFGRDPEVRAQVLDHHREYGRAGARERVFAVVEDGVAQAWAKLWERDGVAQIEDVVCLPAARGQGFGRGVVTAALRAAEGAELTFLVAMEEDWPRRLYAKLGFRRVGTIEVVTRLR